MEGGGGADSFEMNKLITNQNIPDIEPVPDNNEDLHFVYELNIYNVIRHLLPFHPAPPLYNLW